MYGVSKITSAEDVMLISVASSSAASMVNTLEALKEKEIVVDMISQTAPYGGKIHFCFTTSSTNFEAAVATVSHAANSPMISVGYSKINLFGEEMVESVGVAARAMAALQKGNIEVSLITTSDLDISLLVRSEDEDVAIEALQTAFAL